jgi:hypothetical protein
MRRRRYRYEIAVRDTAFSSIVEEHWTAWSIECVVSPEAIRVCSVVCSIGMINRYINRSTLEMSLLVVLLQRALGLKVTAYGDTEVADEYNEGVCR